MPDYADLQAGDRVQALDFILGTGLEKWAFSLRRLSVLSPLCCQLAVGSKVKGRKVDIHNRWYRFDGTELHGTLQYWGRDRLSIVFFTRSGWLGPRCSKEAAPKLEELGFNLPDELWMQEYERAVPNRDAKRQKLGVQVSLGAAGHSRKFKKNRRNSRKIKE